MEVCLGVSLELLLGLTRVNSLENADSPEVLEGELKLADSITSGQVLTSLALCSFLNSFPHFIYFIFNSLISKLEIV